MTIFAETSDRYVEQDVLSALDYTEDWRAFMAMAPGDSILVSNWSAHPAGLTLSDPGVDGGYVSVWVSGGTPGTVYRVTNVIETADGRMDVRHFYLSINDGGLVQSTMQTALFNRFTAVQAFKTASVAFSSGTFPVSQIRDADIWRTLVEAEAEAAHELRVPLKPVPIIPDDATEQERAGLADYRTESAYDYDPSTWSRDAWGFIQLKTRPVVRVDSVKFVYPSPTSTVLEIPDDWLRLDRKYGQLQFVPSGGAMGLGPMYSMMMGALSAGRVIPGMVQVRYTAGIDALRDYPDLVGLVHRMAMLRILKSAFLPGSGSISADGLSQSVTIDQDKWQADITSSLDRLRDTIHGIRFGVF